MKDAYTHNFSLKDRLHETEFPCAVDLPSR